MFSKRLIPGLFAVFCAATPASAAPILLNGTFNANAAGWTLSAACNDARWANETGNPVGSLRLNSCGENWSNPTAQQSVSGFTIGQSYNLEWDIRYDHGGGDFANSFGFFLDNTFANPTFLYATANTAWHTIATSFVATATTHNLVFAAELDPRTAGVAGVSDRSYYIDNVELTAAAEVPEPASLLLLGSGLTVIARRRMTALRRARQQ